MTIKWRLRFSYLVMLIIPIFLIGSIFSIFGSYFNGGNKRNLFSRMRPPGIMTPEQDLFIEKINKIILENPDAFLQSDFLNQLDSELPYPGGIIIKRDNSEIYNSSNIQNPEELRIFQKKPGQKRRNRHSFIFLKWNFLYSNSSKGIIYIIHTPPETTKNIITLMPLITIFVLFLTNGILTFIVYRSIIIPVKELKKAAYAIKNGNLNNKINYSKKDEMLTLCNAFDEMRLRLKKSLEQQILYENNRMELLAAISHDLKTPLTAIKGYTEGIRDGIADSEEKVKKYLDVIFSRANSMDHLIENLFLFSKLDLKKVHFDFEKIDVIELLKKVIAESTTSNVHITFNIKTEKAVFIKGDKNHLRRVFTNIINNSKKYKKNNSVNISIEVIEKDREITIKIMDNGKGIIPEDQPFIFDNFFRADTSRSSRIAGSGIGLAIAKQIIEGHGGRIWVESKQGEGTTIFFILNLLRENIH